MATNTQTGERYIGYTGHREFRSRKSDHVKGALNGWGPGKFASAINEYGPQSFKWEILEEFATAQEALAAEQDYIRRIRPEYNSTSGGGNYKPLVHTEDARKLFRDRALANIDNWRQHARKGPAASARRVVCLNDGSVHESINAAARAYGIANSAIWQVCSRKPRRLRAAGLVFRFEGDHKAPKRQIAQVERDEARRRYNSQAYKRRPVLCIEDGIVFPGAYEAAIHYGVPHMRCDIGEVCRGTIRRGKIRRTVAGKTFRYVEPVL